MLRLETSRRLYQRYWRPRYVASAFSTIPTGTLGDGGTIQVGQFAEKEMCYDRRQVENYAALIADPNPLHTMEGSHQLRQPNKPIVHGMLVASVFSSIFGTLIPGSVYLDQTLKFSNPVRVGDYIIGRIEVTRVRQLQGKRIVACDTIVRSVNDHTIVHVRGKATVWVPGLLPE